MSEKLTHYDPLEDLTSDDDIAIFMSEAFRSNDARYIAHALGVVARVRNMSQIAGQTGLSREQLFLSETSKETIAALEESLNGKTEKFDSVESFINDSFDDHQSR